MRPAHKVINQKLRRAKVLCGEELPVGGGVGERDLILAQVRAVNEVVPARTDKEAGVHVGSFLRRRHIPTTLVPLT